MPNNTLFSSVRRCLGAWLLGLLALAPLALAQDNPAADIEALKQRTLELNRDLLILEEELLYPASSQIAVYLSMDVGEYFALDGVQLKVNDVLVAAELYSNQQVRALHQGGVQKLYIGNIKTGEHEISAFFTGQGPQGQPYTRAAAVTITKSTAPVILELRIVDSTGKLQPVFDIKQWQL